MLRKGSRLQNIDSNYGSVHHGPAAAAAATASRDHKIPPECHELRTGSQTIASLISVSGLESLGFGSARFEHRPTSNIG